MWEGKVLLEEEAYRVLEHIPVENTIGEDVPALEHCLTRKQSPPGGATQAVAPHQTTAKGGEGAKA